MTVTFFIIVYCGREHITFHKAHDQAARVLSEFVERHWRAHFAETGVARPPSADERIELFLRAVKTCTYMAAPISPLLRSYMVSTLDD